MREKPQWLAADLTDGDHVDDRRKASVEEDEDEILSDEGTKTIRKSSKYYVFKWSKKNHLLNPQSNWKI